MDENGSERIDFDALDPRRDAARWEEMVQAVARRGLARRGARSVAGQLLGWARPTIAAAAALAMIVWLGAILRPVTADTATTAAHTELTAWAWNDEVPPPATILAVLGGDDGPR